MKSHIVVTINNQHDLELVNQVLEESDCYPVTPREVEDGNQIVLHFPSKPIASAVMKKMLERRIRSSHPQAE